MVKGFHIFPEGICPKVDITAQLEFELAFYDVADRHVSYYATEIPHIYDNFVHNFSKGAKKERKKKEAFKMKI